jgi:hypothetical protein
VHVILVGILSVLGIVTLQQNPSAGNEGELGPIAYALAAIKNSTFLLGSGSVVGIANGLLLGYLMYRSEPVPRSMATPGLVGGPLVCVTGVAVLFGIDEPAAACRASRPFGRPSGSSCSGSTRSSGASGLRRSSPAGGAATRAAHLRS